MFDAAAHSPGYIRVKICGICNAADANAAVEAGADAIGLNTFRGSKRYLDVATATDWLTDLPDSLRKIAIMVDPSFDEALRVAAMPFITGLQLHGNESPDFCRRLAEREIRFAKALPVRHQNSLARLTSYHTPWLVLDSAPAEGAFGGSGEIFPWEIARDFIQSNPDLRVVLAGGLTPDNVADAIRTVRPFGVDVTTGVEAAPGRKDHAQLRAFIDAARAAI
ncbi:MAG TPA: phosphoribosylanthranilate isomerase [Chthoniobacterales bacterium]